MRGPDGLRGSMGRQQAKAFAVMSVYPYEWSHRRSFNSSKCQEKECIKVIGQRMSQSCCKDLYPVLVLSQRCSYKNSLYIFFVGVILCTELAESWMGVAGDETPLIITDDSYGEGFRYFLRSEVEEQSLVSSLRYTSRSLSFQVFKFIKKWGNDTDILLLGGKDHVYMLDTNFAESGGEITYLERLTWRTQPRAHNECIMMPGQPEELCQNFIRFIELMKTGVLMVCGTNAYSPACRYYEREQFDERIYGEDSDYRDEKKCRGPCVVPHNPKTSSVSLYANTNGGYKIFAAAINGFMANDPIIMKTYDPTLLSNSLWLIEPTFLKIMEYRDKVYVFFREKVEESESTMKEQITYARVAQMCKNDLGGINVLAHQWTSFLKARLRCGYSGRQQFNNLTSVSDIVSSEDAGREIDIFYATFSTPWDWPESSITAVCAFSMEDVTKVFEQGRFFREEIFELTPRSQTQNVGHSPESITKITKSYPIAEELVPNPRPGSCNLSHNPNALYFAKEHPLMYDGVMPTSLAPVYVVHGLRATQIMVDINAGSSGKHMVYIGTDNGKVLRLRSVHPKGMRKAVLIEIISLETKEKCLWKDCTIRSFHISRRVENSFEPKPSLFVAFTDFVVQLPVARCNVYGTQECCSVDPDCGWDGRQCVLRTSQNRGYLVPTSQGAAVLPEVCSIAGLNENCDCKQKKSVECDKGTDRDPGHTFSDGPKTIDLYTLLDDSISSELRKQFRRTIREISSDGQRKYLKTQLKEAVASTVGLVLRNHNQEYCLPLAVNHLTHVYPLVVREIELWHETALKKMDVNEFDPKCWTTDKKCPLRVSFSLPLVPMLWEPLSKLVVNFSGRCRLVDKGGQAAAFRPRPRSQCEALPGLEPCKDIRQPHCRAEKCKFQEYAVDIKAFFRHANDSRQFLRRGDHFEPLWKAVNVTLPSNESFRGHLEVTVSEDQPFVIDYSPVAEKVKIMFHYKAVKDCDLSDLSCGVHLIRSCDSEVEDIIDHWHKWVMRKLPHKMRKCTRQINKLRRQGIPGHTHDQAVPGHGGWNIIQATRDKCRLVRGQVGELSSQQVTRNIWLLIVSRCQLAGGVHYENKIEFYRLQDIQQFFKYTCPSTAPSVERRSLSLKTGKVRSGSPVYAQPMVTTDAPFTIRWNGRVVINFFAEETLRST